MKITNPTDLDIKIVYLGKELSLKAGETRDDFNSAQIAQLQRIYGFLSVSESVAEPIVEEPKKEIKPKKETKPKKESVVSKIKKKIKPKK